LAHDFFAGAQRLGLSFPPVPEPEAVPHSAVRLTARPCSLSSSLTCSRKLDAPKSINSTTTPFHNVQLLPPRAGRRPASQCCKVSLKPWVVSCCPNPVPPVFVPDLVPGFVFAMGGKFVHPPCDPQVRPMRAAFSPSKVEDLIAQCSETFPFNHPASIEGARSRQRRPKSTSFTAGLPKEPPEAWVQALFPPTLLTLFDSLFFFFFLTRSVSAVGLRRQLLPFPWIFPSTTISRAGDKRCLGFEHFHFSFCLLFLSLSRVPLFPFPFPSSQERSGIRFLSAPSDAKPAQSECIFFCSVFRVAPPPPLDGHTLLFSWSLISHKKG